MKRKHDLSAWHATQIADGLSYFIKSYIFMKWESLNLCFLDGDQVNTNDHDDLPFPVV